MIRAVLPDKTIKDWSPSRIIRVMVLTLPFWKAGSDISKVNACLEIEDALDDISGSPWNLDITQEAWTFLKDAMQLNGMNPLPDGDLNRLFMRTYKAILTANEIKTDVASA